MLELKAPKINNSPVTPIRFITHLRGESLWGEKYKKIKKLPSPIAAIHVYSAKKVLGLERFSDMYKASKTQTIIDIEKLIRMSLHQSVLAYEILVGPGFGKLERQFIIDQCFTRELVENLNNEIAKAKKNWNRSKGALAANHFSLLLMRAAISEGIASNHTETILEECALPDFEPLRSKNFDPKNNFELFKELSKSVCKGHHKLPIKPQGYDAVSDFLVKLRLESV